MGEAVLKELARPFECPDILRPDIDALRAAFSDLMDEAAEAVYAAGLDLDDCIVERYADVRGAWGGDVHTVEVDMLSDRERCIERLRRDGASAIVGLRVRVVRGVQIDPFGLGGRPDADE